MNSLVKRHGRRVDAGRVTQGPAGTKIFDNPHVGYRVSVLTSPLLAWHNFVGRGSNSVSF